MRCRLLFIAVLAGNAMARQAPGEGTARADSPFHGVINPVPIFRPEPQYSEEALTAKLEGSVLVSLVVDEAGKPTGIKVIRSLGLGLDEKAVEAASQWKFKPGTKDGEAVPVTMQIVITFRLPDPRLRKE